MSFYGDELNEKQEAPLRITGKGNKMPLVSGEKAKTEKGFGENVKREMDAGKPQKQSVAIAYSKARESKNDQRHKEHR